MARTLLPFKIAAVTMATARNRVTVTDDAIRIPVPDTTRNSRVLVLGGTGRVGGSTAIALSKLCPNLRIIVGGRNRLEENPIGNFQQVSNFPPNF